MLKGRGGLPRQEDFPDGDPSLLLHMCAHRYFAEQQ